MPEGPSIVILKEQILPFKGKKILEATGNTTLIDKDLLTGQKVMDFKSWGKHFLICLPKLTLRIHFMLFGSYSINEQTKPNPRLCLRFAENAGGVLATDPSLTVDRERALYFYACSVRMITEDVNEVYDWSGDVMNESWDPVKARKKLKMMPNALACDVLLDQNVFAGVGNIIKNEVLFRIRVHPESRIGKLPSRKLTELIKEARNYSFDFLEWKKAFELKKHWLAHTKKICPRDHIPFKKVRHLGKTKRRAFYCEACQILYK